MRLKIIKFTHFKICLCYIQRIRHRALMRILSLCLCAMSPFYRYFSRIEIASLSKIDKIRYNVTSVAVSKRIKAKVGPCQKNSFHNFFLVLSCLFRSEKRKKQMTVTKCSEVIVKIQWTNEKFDWNEASSGEYAKFKSSMKWPYFCDRRHRRCSDGQSAMKLNRKLRPHVFVCSETVRNTVALNS